MTSTDDRSSPKGRKVPKLRTPRPHTPHPCRICTEPVVADSPDNALHPDCKIDVPRCCQCGRDVAIPDPLCNACAGTGMIADSACPWCQPSPCVACAIRPVLAAVQQERLSRSHIGPCPSCGQLSALPLGPLCVDCTQRDLLTLDLHLEGAL